MALEKQSLGATYLQDHHAAGIAGTRLARRIATALEADDPSGELHRVATDIAEVLATLGGVMRRRGLEPNRAKDAIAKAAECVARLKTNGRLRGRSPLSDLVELETLRVGIEGKRALWTSLRAAGVVPDDELARLVERADQQAHVVEAARLSAARRTLG